MSQSSPQSRTEIPEHFDALGFRPQFSNFIGPFYVSRNQNIFQTGVKLVKHHGGGPNRGHGGVSMTVLDEAMGRAASHACGNLSVTISMTTNFISSTRIDDFIIATAEVKRHGKSIIFVDATLHAGEKLLATATGTWMNTGEPIPETVNTK